MNTIRAYSPFAPEVKHNPYPYYTWLRQNHPVYYNSTLDFWALSRYEDVELAARNHTAFSSAQGVGPEKQPGISIIEIDPPNHTRLRTLVSKAFTPHIIERSASRIQQIVDDRLDAVIAKGTFDLIQDLAHPLPVIVLAEMLGVDPKHRDDFQRWSNDVIYLLIGTQRGRDVANAQQSLEAFSLYISQMTTKRRQQPQADLFTALAMAEEEQERLTDADILNTLFVFMAAGNEATTNLIGNGIQALLTHPEQENKLRDNLAHIESMIEEVNRFDSPVQVTFRTTTQDIEVGGVTIPADRKVALLLAAANRDPEVFVNPDRFDIERPAIRHLGFSAGIHLCPGAPLARLQARIAIATLVRRMKRLTPNSGRSLERVENISVRGLKQYPLTFKLA